MLYHTSTFMSYHIRDIVHVEISGGIFDNMLLYRFVSHVVITYCGAVLKINAIPCLARELNPPFYHSRLSVLFDLDYEILWLEPDLNPLFYLPA